MKVEIFCFGKVKDAGLISLEKEYLKRMGPFWEIKVIELPLGKGENSKREEGKRLLDKLDSKVRLIALDERGKEFNSLEFSKQINPAEHGGRTLALAIGGPSGWDKPVKERANLLMSFSKLTMPYALARLLLVEQLYRATTILNGSPYHK